MQTNIEKLEGQLAAAETEQTKIDALNALALALHETEPERAFGLATDAYQRSHSGDYAAQSYLKGVAHSLSILAWYEYEHAANYIAAIEYASEGLACSKNIGDPAGQIRALYICGLIHRRIGNYPQAVNCLLDALNLAQQHGDLYHEAQTQRAIANIYNETKDHEKALNHCQVALELFGQLKDDYHYALMLNNISMYHTNVGNYEKALEYGFQSLGIFIKIDSLRGKGIVEDTIAQAYAGFGEYGKAVEYMLRNLEHITAQGPKSYQAQALLNVGKIYLQDNRPDDAMPYLQQALEIAQSIESKAHIYGCHEQLSMAFEQRGDIQQSLVHLKQYVAVYNEVVNAQSLEKLTLLEVAHQAEKAEAEADIQRRLHEQNRLYRERLAHVRDQLMSSTSRDLKNPLGAILNYVYLLRMHDTTLDDTSQDYLERIESQVEQVRDLISDLLELAQLETGRVLDCTPVTLDEFITSIVVENMAQAQTKNIRLDTLDYPTDLTVMIDPLQMRRALNNLIANAIQFTSPAGRITISVDYDPDWVTIVVEDTGIGIAPDDLPHIFEQFYRVNPVNHNERDETNGTGLGLAIVKVIVEQHAGTVGVTSEVGKGSRFYFSLPRVLDKETAAAQPSDYAEQGG